MSQYKETAEKHSWLIFQVTKPFPANHKENQNVQMEKTMVNLPGEGGLQKLLESKSTTHSADQRRPQDNIWDQL